MPPPSPAPDRPLAGPDAPPSDAPDLDALAAQLADRVAQLVDAARTPPPLLDLAGAAARLNVSTRTVEALVASGDIPVTRIGAGRGVRRFDPAAVEAFIRRQTRTL
ncbi:helix-turn-helix domain-containing protein [Rubrivirga sp. IMCC43871]|uniref:helix-turn-helix domain-containing protein n=1 Tax=Rubrivirga sp. IMCC43871 TaxID=3391575 RepID=UPI00398FA900